MKPEIVQVGNTFTVHSQELVSRPSEIVANTELLPICEVVGVKDVWLDEEPLKVANTPAPGSEPLRLQAKVRGSASVSDPLAVRLNEAGIATTLPSALGVCEAQMGAVFLTTVQLRVAVLVPFESVATNVLDPAVNADERTSLKLAALPKVCELRVQVTSHEGSLGTIAKLVDVLPAAATLTVDTDGLLDVTAQLLATFNVQLQVAVSKPSSILATITFSPMLAPAGEKVAMLCGSVPLNEKLAGRAG